MDRLHEGDGSGMVPQEVIVEMLVGPMLELLVNQPFLARMTIGNTGAYQVDVLKLMGTLEGEAAERGVYTYELYEYEVSPRTRDELDVRVPDAYLTPQEAFKAGLAALEAYVRELAA